MIVHIGDQGLTDRVGHFKEDVAIALGANQLPNGQTVVERQGLENVGDVGGVQIVELALQLNQILAVDKIFHQVMVMTFLAMSQVFNYPLALQ
ncbi:hypothetical protein D3C80_2072590 [compost metagenome]